MTRLRNPRQERFARLVAAGAEVSAAYREAGYRARGAGKRALALAARPLVVERIEALNRAWDEGRETDTSASSNCGDSNQIGRGLATAVTNSVTVTVIHLSP